MDNDGGQPPMGDMPPADGSDQMPGPDMGQAAPGGDENVDQYFDDGGETFLPADHVSSPFQSKLPSQAAELRLEKARWRFEYLKCNR